jgi:hypothetical protein
VRLLTILFISLVLASNTYAVSQAKNAARKNQSFLRSQIDHNSFMDLVHLKWQNKIFIFGDVIFNYINGVFYKDNDGQLVKVRGQNIINSYVNLGIEVNINKQTLAHVGLTVGNDWIISELAAKADQSQRINEVLLSNRLFSLACAVREAYVLHQLGNIYVKVGRYYLPFGLNKQVYMPLHTFTQSLTQINDLGIETGLDDGHMLFSMFAFTKYDLPAAEDNDVVSNLSINNMAYGGQFVYRNVLKDVKYLLQIGFLSYVADILHARNFNVDDILTGFGIARAENDDLNIEQQGFAYHVATRLDYHQYEYLFEYTTYGDTRFISQNEGDVQGPIVVKGLCHWAIAYHDVWYGKFLRLALGYEQPINNALLPVQKSLYFDARLHYMKNVQFDTRVVLYQGTQAFNQKKYNSFFMLGLRLVF